MDTDWIKEKSILNEEADKRTLELDFGKLEWQSRVIYHARRNYHDDREFTAYFDLEIPPSALVQDCLDRMYRNETILLKVGFALCHPKEQYCKKTGRELAKTKMDDYHFEISHIRRDDNAIVLGLIFSSINGNCKQLHNEIFDIRIFPSGRISIC